MNSAAKDRLLRLVRESLPLDKIQRSAAEEGIDRLTDDEASGIANDIEDALSALPETLTHLEALLSAEEAQAASSAEISSEDVAIVLEGDEAFRSQIEDVLCSMAYDVRHRMTASEVLADLESPSRPTLVLADDNMQSLEGFELLRLVKEEAPDTTMVAIRGPNELASAAIECKKIGAQLLMRDLPTQIFNLKLQQIADLASARREVERVRFGALVGSSAPMQEVFRTVEKVAAIDVPVHIMGEYGTEKELVAREIHRRSPRSGKPFLAVNCGVLPEALLESFLFGEATAAVTERQGLLKDAAGGTLFLDEISELPVGLQAKLLCVVQEQEVERVGGEPHESIDVRLLTASNRDLGELVRSGEFREALFYRLSVVKLDVPSLRERASDILPIAFYMLRRAAHERGSDVRGFTHKAAVMLQRYQWPGNVWELKSRITRALGRAKGPLLTDLDLGLSGELLPRILPLCQAQESFEREYIREVLALHGDDVSKAARALQIEVDRLRECLGRDASRGES